MKNGLFLWFLCLICLVAQSCTTYSVLPKNIRNHSDIEGVYSNVSEIDTMKNIGQRIDSVFYRWWEVDSLKHKAYRTKTIWSIVNRKHEIKVDTIIVKIEIVNTKSLMFSFSKDNDIIGTKLLKGKFKKDECFYTRRIFFIVPILPVLWCYVNSQKRIYRFDNELVIETTWNSGGAVIIMASGMNINEIWRFKQINRE